MCNNGELPYDKSILWSFQGYIKFIDISGITHTALSMNQYIIALITA